jgi:hypothetical protein
MRLGGDPCEIDLGSILARTPPLVKCNSGSKCRVFFRMATGPCWAGFAGTHYYIYLGWGESVS